jgi:hypothetical protein
VDPLTPTATKDVSIGVKASIGIYGDLILSTVDANGSDPISIGPSKKADGTYEQNALGLEPIDYTADERLNCNSPVIQPSLLFDFHLERMATLKKPVLLQNWLKQVYAQEPILKAVQ